MSKKPEDFIVSAIRFLGEQDGIPERKLKARLRDLLSEKGIQCRAYLARVAYSGARDFDVALCLRLEGEMAEDLSGAISQTFSDLFRTDEHLDVLTLSDQQERELLEVAAPFFDTLQR